MNKNNINLEDYVSDPRLKEIAEEEFRRALREDPERILNNMAYKYVAHLVDDLMDDEMKAHVKEKTKEVIQELSTYTVYHTPTRYDDHKSLAYQFMEEAVIENRQVIFDCVLKKIEAYPYESKIFEKIDNAVGVWVDKRMMVLLGRC